MEIVVRGLAPTRARARDLVLAGAVRVAGAVATKPGATVGAASAIEVEEAVRPYVSRGGVKLAHALDRLGFSPEGRVCLDIGASTGGFTDVLLSRGAIRVHAVDVGHGQLAARLAADRRVVVHEGVNARHLGQEAIGEAVDAVVADVSFISLTLVLPPALGLTRPGAFLVALVKPQFEAGRAAVGRGGIVTDARDRAAALHRVEAAIASMPGWRIAGTLTSPIEGQDGNVEMLIGAERHA
ncbi:MAG: TlyA family RNA methyltransferase [Hyphomicrobiaceae bacterium]